jgi:hypothetical protein
MTNSKIERLKASVLKAQEKVEKKKATIERHEKQLIKKVEKLEKVYGKAVEDIHNLDAIKWIDGKGADWYWEACDVQSKLRDIKGAEKNLRDAEIVLANWEEKLEAEIAKDDFISTIPQVLKDFLNAWKQRAYDWHVQRYEKFVVFKEDLYKREAEVIKECQGMSYRGRREYMKEKGLDDIRGQLVGFGGVVIVEMDKRNEKERLAYLEATLENEKRRKAIDLVNRIKDVVGEITDASKLEVNEKLNLDGYIYGTIGKAKVETIGAGGYNIQCFHYRTLVHKIA